MTEHSNTFVHLATDDVEFMVEGKLQRLPCEVVLETDPRPRVSFKVASPGPWSSLGFGRDFSVHIVNADITCEAILASGSDGMLNVSPTKEPITVGFSGVLKKIEFDLINFPKFVALKQQPGSYRDNGLLIEAGGWRIEIGAPRNSSEVEAFRSPLYSITHSCILRKSDDATFSSSDAQFVLNALHDALSFAAGRWVAPVLVRGAQSDDQIAWSEWGTRPLHPDLGRVETWFDAHHPNGLAEILPGILKLRQDPERSHSFHSALYWYLRSTGLAAGVDGGIILLQAALEMLSWQTFVTDRKVLSRDGFSRLPADDQIRLLIENCGIPAGIPAGLTELHAKSKEFNWSDGPKALTAIRNLLVHPATRKRFPYYDAWSLGEWYVELVLLRMLSFEGEYSDRTKAERWVGAVDRVPWANF